MTTTAFPVRQTEAGVGCTDIAMRKIFGALYPDKGVITGLSVKGGNSLSYTVSEGVAVCSKGSADGSTLAYFEGGSVDVSANSSSNPRIDVVWITSHDVTQGDSDNLVTIGVTEGTAAATPTEPDVPSYATKLQAMRLPASATTTASATAYGSQDMAVPYGASLGLIAENINTANNKELDATAGVKHLIHTLSFSFSSPRIVQFCISASVQSISGVYSDGEGSVFCAIEVDGTQIDRRELRIFHKFNSVSQYYAYTYNLGAGNHTVKVYYIGSGNASKYFLEYNKGVWGGQQIQVVDLGPVD